MFCKFKKIISICISIFMCVLYLGCKYNKDVIESDTKVIKIGVTIFDKHDPFILSVAKELEELVKEKNNESKYKISVDVVDGAKSAITQYDQVNMFINQNYDVICVSMFDRTAASTIIDKAKKANKPVIFFNSEPVEEDMNLWDKVYYVGANSEESGKMQAEIVIDLYNSNKYKVDRNKDDKIQYVMLEGDPEHQDTLIRTDYSIKALVENGIKVEKLADDTAHWQSDQGYEKMRQWINEYGNKIELVMSNNDDMAIGAIQALDDLGIKKEDRPIIVGTDGIESALNAIKNKSMLGTVFNDYESQAEYIFNISYALASESNNISIEGLENGKYIKTHYSKVTEENVDAYL